jgi:DNA-binding transcriptional LysR family regulator
VKLNHLDLNKLNVFMVAAEHGGFSTAARRLALTRSAVSQSITGLERSLGFPLFYRVGRTLVLTERGRTLADRVRAYQAGLETVLGELTDENREPSGTARLGIFVGFSKARLTDFLARFLRQYTQITVKVLFLSQAELMERLRDRRIDVALSIHPFDHPSGDLESKRLFEEELVLVSSPKLYLANPTLDQIRQLPIIEYYEGGEVTSAWIRHHFSVLPGDLKIRAYAGAVDYVLELIQKNVGVGIVPHYVASPLLRSGRLRHIRTKRPELVDAIWLNQVRGAHHEPAAAKLAAELAAGFAKSAGLTGAP